MHIAILTFQGFNELVPQCFIFGNDENTLFLSGLGHKGCHPNVRASEAGGSIVPPKV